MPLGARARLMPYVFVVPGVILLCITVLYPLLDSLHLSLSDWPIARAAQPRRFAGFANYARIALDPLVLQALGVTAVFVVISVTSQLLAGLALGLLLDLPLRARNLLRSLSVLPLVMAPLVVGLTWRYIFHAEFGLANYFLSLVGIRPLAWLSSSPWALLSIIVADSWRAMPFVALVVLAGLQAIPDEVYDAAKIDGASAWQLFQRVTLPLLRPALLVILVVRTTDAVNMVDKPFIMTQGGPFRSTETLAYYVYELGFQRFDLPYAAGLSWLITVLVLVMSLIYVRLLLVRIDL